ncbi:sugar transferase [Bacillus sp. N1-1]|nr:sugar transferase [Bacillus sp. N1-1]
MESVKTYANVGKRSLAPLPQGYYMAKRVIDFTLAFMALVLLSPVFLFLWIIYLFDHGPVLFKQKRYGKNGKVFYIYKFRSMVSDAEEVLKKDVLLYQRYLANNYKLEPHEDPRITKIGRFLRKTSLDELPQLLNVLKGEMSLVGPRPIVDEELQQYGDRKNHFLSVKPGMTGYWQISGRSAVGYPERVDIELFYVYNQSLKLDMKIIFGTFGAVLKKRGAY